MDERVKPTISELVLEVVRPLYYASLMVSPAMVMDDNLRPAVSALYGTGAVWLIILWLNRRNDPRHAKRPPDDP